jgi:membrane-associated phospholipid phosphatase
MLIPLRRAVMAACALALLAGCTTLPDGSRWGARSTFDAGWDRVGEAALQAAKSPWVWAPLAGAAVLQIDDWDQGVSDWAYDSNPVFGSVQHAQDWSDYLEVTAGVAYVGSVLATPSGDYGSDWWSAKLRGGMVGIGAIGAASLTVEGLKQVVTRERPDGNPRSFPSGHAAVAASADTLTVRNLQSIPMSDGARTAFTVGADVLTFGTAWARVEAGAHYPSDVLVGMSIGNFFGLMFSDAFLNDGLSERLALSFEPLPGGGEVAWQWKF